MEEIYLKIKEMCLASKTTNPTKLVTTIMNEDFIHIHGPEHHILDGACLLSAIFNAGLSFNLENALDEMICIGKQMPGATCEKMVRSMLYLIVAVKMVQMWALLVILLMM